MNKQLLFLVFSILLTIFSIVSIFFGIQQAGKIYLKHYTSVKADTSQINDATKQKILTQITNQNLKIKRKLNTLVPPDPYIVINVTYNRFKLYKNKKLVHRGFCSTGSYILLKGHDKREWIFQTPQGYYSIHGKVTSPVWWRPDWSFVEEGLPVPPRNHPSRWESGVLGEYALSIGDGYLIHGTLYKRFLGMPVTHGCIRMNDEDLEKVYHTLNVGSKVYIY